MLRTDYLRRIDLVQDLEFNTAATRMKTTSDGQYIIASGMTLHSFEIYFLNILFLSCSLAARYLEETIVDYGFIATPAK